MPDRHHGPGGKSRLPLSNEQIAVIFDETADLLALENANPYRVRAYRRAAQFIRGQQRELTDRVAAGEDLADLPAIGTDLRDQILQILRTGRSTVLVHLRRRVPHGLLELLHLPGLGPRRVRTLADSLGIRSRAGLARALKAGRVAGVPGIGPALCASLARGLADSKSSTQRWLRSRAVTIAEPLAAWLRRVPGVGEVEIAGSYRRGRDTVGDLDFVVTADRGIDLVSALKRRPEVRGLTASGTKRLTLQLRVGLQVDLRVCTPESAGAMLQYLTGSQAHVVRLRRLAQRRGLQLNEYGVYRRGRRLAGSSENSVYRALGLPCIVPELREDRGEFEAARAHELPRLLTSADLRGDLHVHTSASDGQDSLRAIAVAAQARGYEYLGITDHSRYQGITHGLDARQLRRQAVVIDRLNEELEGLTLLKGVEVDILADGRLALPERLLSEFDFVVGAVHSHFDLDERRQTARLLRAMEHGHFTILAHPTARLIGSRPPLAIDLEVVLAAARARPCYLELNAQPERLDLDDVQCRRARELGVLVSLASDAHAASQLGLADAGVLQARRGWLRAVDVLNTRPLARLRSLLAATRR